jgi:hypothetical protein
MLNEPFMLKGSYVTRQYFANPTDRLTNDLDWLCLEKLDNVDYTKKMLDEWAIKVTEIELNDGVKFRSFSENAFWRMIDYAMSEDFPTVNTDILAWIDGEEFEFSMDVSFNLEISVDPISLEYKPLNGEKFIVPNTVPLPLQISWKLHQTLVRPRFKDLFDLIHLLKHPTFNDEMRDQTIKALVDECFADSVNPKRLGLIIEGNLTEIFKPYSAKREWHFWRIGEHLGSHSSYEWAKWITNPDSLPKDLESFEQQIRESFANAGFTKDLATNLPLPSNYKEKKKTLFDEFTPLNNDELEENVPFLNDYEKKKQKPSFFDTLRSLFK